MCRRRLARRSSARACAALSLYLRIARLLPFEFGTVILAARALLTASTGVFILTRTHRACSFLYSSVSSSVSRNIFGTASTTNSLSCADAHTHGHQSAHTREQDARCAYSIGSPLRKKTTRRSAPRARPPGRARPRSPAASRTRLRALGPSHNRRHPCCCCSRLPDCTARRSSCVPAG